MEIEHWVASLEAHLYEDTQCDDKHINLYHYHMVPTVAKLKVRERWAQVRDYLMTNIKLK